GFGRARRRDREQRCDPARGAVARPAAGRGGAAGDVAGRRGRDPARRPAAPGLRRPPDPLQGPVLVRRAGLAAARPTPGAPRGRRSLGRGRTTLPRRRPADPLPGQGGACRAAGAARVRDRLHHAQPPARGRGTGRRLGSVRARVRGRRNARGRRPHRRPSRRHRRRGHRLPGRAARRRRLGRAPGRNRRVDARAARALRAGRIRGSRAQLQLGPRGAPYRRTARSVAAAARRRHGRGVLRAMAPGFRRWLWIALRLLVAAACIAYLARQVYEVSREMALVEWLPASAFLFACLAAPVFAATAWLLALAWRVLLRALGQDVRLSALARTLFLTQPAKYLPGNVGHHVGRVALARRTLQIPVGTCIASLMQEGALLCLAAMLTALACVMLQPWPIPSLASTGWESGAPWLLAAAIAAGLLALAVVNAWRRSRHVPRVRGMRWLLDAAPSWPTTLRASPWYMATSLLNGAGLMLLALPLLDSTSGLFLPLTAAFA